MYHPLWMKKMFGKRNLWIGALETNELLKTIDSPKTLLVPQLKTIKITSSVTLFSGITINSSNNSFKQ